MKEGFKTINYTRFTCVECQRETVIEPSAIFDGKFNCDCKREVKLDDTEISEPVKEEIDYVKTQTVTVIGVFLGGDYEVCNSNDLSDTWRVPKKTFEDTYKMLEDTVNYSSAPELCLKLSLLDLKGMTPEDIKAKYNMDELRALGKAVALRSYHNLNEDKLVARLLKKAE